MDFSYSDENKAFRREVRAFVGDAWGVVDRRATPAEEAEFRARATAAGYLYRGIPKHYCGSEQDADLLKSEIIREEFRRAGAPVERNDRAITRLVPTLLQWGSDWQKDFFIPRTITGEILWAQGYSEPNAGNDLASLRTRAELVDGQWIINGQKIWSSRAHLARYMYMLVRTEAAPRHEGISYLLVDLDQPGIEIRQIKQINGDAEFCEVFFTDAVTPADWIVGERGRGWAVSRTTLKYERSGIHSVNWADSILKRMVRLAGETEREGGRALDEPELRKQLAALQARVAAMRYSAYRAMSMEAAGEDPGSFPLMMKLYLTNILHDMVAIARDLLGDDYLLATPGREDGRQASAKWIAHAVDTLKVAIAGGSSNIQLNIIGERGLGLPRDGVGVGA